MGEGRWKTLFHLPFPIFHFPFPIFHLVSALALTSALTSCARAPAAPPKPTNLLIVTIDTLRADRLGVYGAANVSTPQIDRLAREGAWAPQADVHAPLTRPSHASLFTGLYPAEHGIRDNISPPLPAERAAAGNALRTGEVRDCRLCRVCRARSAVRSGAWILTLRRSHGSERRPPRRRSGRRRRDRLAEGPGGEDPLLCLGPPL